MRNRIYIEITNRCNLSCDFCHGTRRPPRTMTPAEFETLALKLRGETDYLYLHVLGEPLLHPQLPEVLAIAHCLGFRTCLVTNGTLLPRQKDALLSAPGLHKLSVSLHSFEGSAQSGDMSAYLRGVWDAVLPLSQKGILCALRLWNEGAAEALPQDARGNRTLSPNLFLERAERFAWPDLSAPETGANFCHGLTRQLAVLCDGTVTPCCLDSEGTIALGNLFTQALPEILRSPRAAAMAAGFAARRPSEDLCRRCGYARRFSK